MEKNPRGVILAGGKGTRLRPETLITNKHLIGILQNPMILYPLNTLKALGVEDILLVSGGEHIGGFTEFLGDGSRYGVNLTYRVQKDAGGIAEALGLAEDFAHGGPITAILGDNIFENGMFRWGKRPNRADGKAKIFTRLSQEPHRFGVVTTEGGKRKVVEKPKDAPVPSPVVTGLYMYPNDVFEIIPTLVPSGRGELEISDVNNWYLEQGRAEIIPFEGFWTDAGTPESLHEAINWAWSAIPNQGLDF